MLAWSTLPNCIVTKSSLSTVTDTTSVFVRSINIWSSLVAPIPSRATWQLGTLAWAGQAHYRAPYLWARLSIWASYLGFCDIVLSRRRCTGLPEKGIPMRSTWDKVFSLDTPGLISWTWCLDLISQIISYPGSLWSIIVCASCKVSPRKSLKMFFGRCLKAGQLTGQHERHHLKETVWDYRRRKSPDGVLCLR